jgi:hypothetical protein
VLVAPGLLVLTLGAHRSAGDEPSRLGRLFRFGGGSTPAASPTPAPNPSPAPASTPPAAPLSAPALPDASTPAGAGANASPRIFPRPRVSRPVTESDPILTRITLNRSDDGNSFGMFLQVFADGTIIDSEGVHNVGQEALKPLIEALQAGDLYRTKGHCGAPGADYVETIHVIVFERSLGRLRSNAFSYSGNPQGCSSAIAHLHGTLENLQAKLVRAMPAGPIAGPVAPEASAPPLPATSPGASPTVIPLTSPE